MADLPQKPSRGHLTASFHLLPGIVASPTDYGPPFRHSFNVPILEDFANVNVSSALRDEGVDIDGLILLSRGEWDEDTYVVAKADGSEERMTEADMEERWKACLGRFKDEIGTLVGEISFTTADGASSRFGVKFHAPVYLTNRNRMGILKPPTFEYDVVFDTKNIAYQRRVQISQVLPPGEADRFTLKIAVAQSSIYRFRATLRDISGLTLKSLPIEMHCFVPRSRHKRLEEVIYRATTE